MEPATLDDWTGRYREVIAPFWSQPGFARVSFVEANGVLIEFMEFTGDPEQWYPEASR